MKRKLLKKRVLFPVLSLLASLTALSSASSSMVEVAAGKIFREATAVPSRYAAIVLGAAAAGGVPSTILEDRLKAALALYKAGKVQRLLLTGDHGDGNYDEPNTMRKWLLAAGVADSDLFLDHAGFRTLDSMARAKDVFEVTDAVIVTQEFHLPRALFLASSYGIDAVGFVADSHVYSDAPWNATRESVARFVAWVDVAVLRRQPRFLGPRLPITGDAALTHDSTP